MCSVFPLLSDSLRARRIPDSAVRFRTAFLAMATTYSNFGCASKNSSTAGWAKPPVKANPNAHSRKTATNDPDQPPQQPYRTHGGGDVAGTQHCRAQILFGFLIETDKTHHR